LGFEDVLSIPFEKRARNKKEREKKKINQSIKLNENNT